MTQDRPLYSLMQQWLQECQGVMSPETLAQYAQLMEDHIIPSLGDRLQFTEEEVTAFLDGKVAAGMSEVTVAMMERVLRRVMEYGQSIGACDGPSWNYRPGTPKTKHRPVVLSPEEEKLLADYLVSHPSHLGLCLFLVLTCGLTAGEVMGIQGKDVSVRGNSLRVHLSRGALLSRKNRTREVALGERQRIYLRKMMTDDPEAYLNSGTQNTRSVTALDIRLKKIVQELPLPPWTTPKSLRNTYAVRCIEGGMDYEALAKNLGVDNGSTFRQYYRQLVSEEQRERLEQERFENRKVRQAPAHTAHLGPDISPEVVAVRRKVEAKKAQLQEELDNLSGDLEIIRALRHSDGVQGKAREGFYRLVEQVLGPDDKDGQYLVEYLRSNMRVESMPLRVNRMATVQTIRRRVAKGFEKLCRKLEALERTAGC